MKGKKIIVTGISGSGSRDFCSNYVPDAMTLKRYHTGDMIYRAAQDYSQTPIPKENLLNLHPNMLAMLRDNVFGDIKEDIEAKNPERVIIDTHGQFFWNQVYQNAYDWKNLQEINADMYITIIDKPSSIKARQMQTFHGRSQGHDLRDLLLWQNNEVNIAQSWAERFGKPMYALSNQHNPADIDSLLDNHFLIYSSFAMTDATQKDTKKIENFKKRLRGLRKSIDGHETPIIDPAHIDIETDPELSSKVRDAIDEQTVHRDLNWDIKQATHVIAYYPSAEIDLSKGVSDETTEAIRTGKFVYVICPRAKQSPFMDIATEVFRDERKFFKEKMKDDLEFFRR